MKQHLITFTLPENTINRKTDLSVKECGLSNQENRIVGGRPAEPNKYPWLARLVYDGKFHCGASLLTNDYVITAAHCLRKYVIV